MIKFITLQNGKFVATSSIIQRNTLNGTQNQILINGGTSQFDVIIGTKSVTLTLPQDIAKSSDVQFNKLLLQNGLNVVDGVSIFGGNVQLSNKATQDNHPVRADRIIYLSSSFSNIITSQASNKLTTDLTMSIGWNGQLQLSKGGTNADLSTSPNGSIFSIINGAFVSIDNIQNSNNRILLFQQNSLPTISQLHYLNNVPQRSLIYVKQNNILTSSTYQNNTLLYVNNDYNVASSNRLFFTQDKNQLVIGVASQSNSITSGAGFESGFAGSGYSLWFTTQSNKSYLHIDNLTVRGTMHIFQLMINQIRATNGSLFVSSALKIKSAQIVTGNIGDSGSIYKLQVDSQVTDVTFIQGDVIRCQRLKRGQNNTIIYRYDLVVTQVDYINNKFSATLNSAQPPLTDVSQLINKQFVRLGNTSNTDRQGNIYLTSDQDNSPYIDIVNNITSHNDWNSPGKVKARIGKLDGISDVNFGGFLQGYGLYANNVYLTGRINALEGGRIAGWNIQSSSLTYQKNNQFANIIVDNYRNSFNVGNQKISVSVGSLLKNNTYQDNVYGFHLYNKQTQKLLYSAGFTKQTYTLPDNTTVSNNSYFWLGKTSNYLKFYNDTLTLKGGIIADTGSIAGWEITSNAIRKIDQQNNIDIGIVSDTGSMYIGKDGIYTHFGKLWNNGFQDAYGFGIADSSTKYFQVGYASESISLPNTNQIPKSDIYFWLGNSTNYIQWSNTQNQLLLSGKITATQGSIGGWSIDTNKLYKDKISLATETQYWDSVQTLPSSSQIVNISNNFTSGQTYFYNKTTDTTITTSYINSSSISQQSTISIDFKYKVQLSGSIHVNNFNGTYAKLAMYKSGSSVPLRSFNIYYTTDTSVQSIKYDYKASQNYQKIYFKVYRYTQNDSDTTTYKLTLYPIIVQKYIPKIQLSNNGLLVFNSPSNYTKLGYIQPSSDIYNPISIFKGQWLQVQSLIVYDKLYNYGQTFISANDLLGTTANIFVINSLFQNYTKVSLKFNYKDQSNNQSTASIYFSGSNLQFDSGAHFHNDIYIDNVSNILCVNENGKITGSATHNMLGGLNQNIITKTITQTYYVSSLKYDSCGHLTQINTSSLTRGTLSFGTNTNGFSFNGTNTSRLFGSGQLKINIPQRIDTGSTPTFQNLNLTRVNNTSSIIINNSGIIKQLQNSFFIGNNVDYTSQFINKNSKTGSYIQFNENGNIIMSTVNKQLLSISNDINSPTLLVNGATKMKDYVSVYNNDVQLQIKNNGTTIDFVINI